MSTDLDDWGTAIENAILLAASRWTPRVLDAMLPSLTAAALPPDPDRMDDERDSWWKAFTQHVLPVIAGLMAVRTGRVLRGRNITPPTPDADDSGTDMKSAADAIPWPVDVLGALTAEERAKLVTSFTDLREIVGELLPAGDELIVKIPSWKNHTADYLSVVSNRCKNMPDAVFNEIRATLAEGIDAGETPTALAARVRDHLDMATEGGREAWETRARRIAQTETTGAYNAASIEAARIEEAETGTKMEKAWVCTTDTRTRDTHFAADGQRVALNDMFLIGGHRLSYPGDPQGPAAEIVNCRCTTIVLAADEPLPGETDRQTERERADGSRRNPAAEVKRRAADGVTRARQDPAGIGFTAAAAHEEKRMRRPFSGVLAPIGAPTGDGRIIDAAASIDFREFPLPLMWQRATGEGHDQSVIIGRIDTATVQDGEIISTGVLFESSDAAEAAALLDDEVIRPSVDLCDMVAEFLLLDADGQAVDPDTITSPDDLDGLTEMTVVREATVMAATLVAKPAFAEAKLSLGEPITDEGGAGAEETLTAAATLSRPTVNPDVFSSPNLGGPTGLTVTEDHRVYGHLALWDTCHIGMADRCVTPPRSGADYSFFHTSTVDGVDGPIAVGRLTVGGGHAAARAGLAATVAHYDDTGTCWAYVRAGEDQHGIWVAGIVNPDASENSVAEGSAAPLSGDWRSVGGRLELVAALSVNTPGFPVPRSYSDTAGRASSLVAAGAVQTSVRPAAGHIARAQIQELVNTAIDLYVEGQARKQEAAAIRERIAAREAARLTSRHIRNYLQKENQK